MYACPWCGQQSFSFWDKQTLGPKRALTCRHCNRKVTVSWDRAQLAALPVLAFGFLGLLVGKAVFGTWPAVFLFGWLGVTVGAIITAPLYHLYVPLVKPE